MSTGKGEGVYNAVVIGAGTAGLVTAAGTAGLGGRVALVERHRMGGDCLNTGCVPSKALIASARLRRAIARGARWGLGNHDVPFRFEDVIGRVRERRAHIAPHDSQERFESLGVDVFRGDARLVSPCEVEVDGRRLRGRHVVIATGSRAVLPPVPGLAEAEPYTNETVFDAFDQAPRRLIVVGGGPIGCELGQALQALGVQVTIVEAAPRLLGREDEEAAALLAVKLAADGLGLLTGVKLARVERQGAEVHVWIEGAKRPLVADAILVAAGRAPNVEGLGLDAAGIAHGKGGVRVDAHLQASQPRVWAAGDVVGGPQFTHLADHHARVVVRNILIPWWRASIDTRVLPRATFTSPELAQVGLTEADAQAQGVAVDVWRQDVKALDRAMLDGEEDGFVKVLTAKGTDRIVGATLVCAHAGDLVHELALAMKAGIGLGRVGGTIHAYPTWAELARRASDQYQKSRLTPFARRLFSWLHARQR